jgi:hypothetical protein
MESGPHKHAAIRQACFEYRNLRKALDVFYANGWEHPQVPERPEGEMILSGQTAAIGELDNATIDTLGPLGSLPAWDMWMVAGNVESLAVPCLGSSG